MPTVAYHVMGRMQIAMTAWCASEAAEQLSTATHSLKWGDMKCQQQQTLWARQQQLQGCSDDTRSACGPASVRCIRPAMGGPLRAP